MMEKIPSGNVCGKMRAPSSKSMMQRAVAAAALAKGKSIIRNPSFCEDALAALGIARCLGAQVEMLEREVAIKGGNATSSGTLDCDESGLCMRMFCAISAALDGEFTLVGKGTLGERQLGGIEAPIVALGARCETQNGHAPVKISGKMKGGEVRMDGSKSSQLLSGLLMALPLCEKNSLLHVESLKSRPYVRMTLQMLQEFGVEVGADATMERFAIKGGQQYKPASVEIEGDWSGASFMLVAGAIAGEVKVEGLAQKSLQADRVIVDALKDAGATVLQEENAITVAKASLRALEFDATDCPDLFPPLVALACSCKGRSVLRGAGRLKNKESDRAAALVKEFTAMGAKVGVQGDEMRVEGGELKGGSVQSHGDHRIAMACAVAALASNTDVQIQDAQCVAKSYPNFFGDLEKLRVE
ncbi:3-phosphoshikimate 1-carboxyvinyltransferase [Candidatus Micrarchaeota archaeon]|nr:3-phosphoshikimate 1-carboxyvinyltransferase [Candidatus Micrarchaeota archaeon]